MPEPENSPLCSERMLDVLIAAAHDFGVPPEEVRASDHRRAARRDRGLPSEAAVRDAFGSRARAREKAARSAR